MPDAGEVFVDDQILMELPFSMLDGARYDRISKKRSCGLMVAVFFSEMSLLNVFWARKILVIRVGFPLSTERHSLE